MLKSLGAFKYGKAKISPNPAGKPYGNKSLKWLDSWSADIDGDGNDEIIHGMAVDGGLTRTKAGPVAVLEFRNGKMVDISKKVFGKTLKIVSPEVLFLEDYNGDGKIDLLFTNGGPDAVAVPLPPGEQNMLFLSKPGGGFANATNKLPQITDAVHGSLTADFDGDGDLDVFVNNLGDDDGYYSYMMFNDGNGNFSEPHFTADSFTSTPFSRSDHFSEIFGRSTGPYRPALIDYEGDGDWDIYWVYTTTHSPDQSGFAVAVNDGNGNFDLVYANELKPAVRTKDIKSGKTATEWHKWGDLDNDGDDDLLAFWVEGSGKNRIGIQYLENRGTNGYVDVSHKIEGTKNGFFGRGSGAPQFQLVDFDADGDLDIVYHKWKPSFDSAANYWFANDGKGNFERIDPDLFPGSQFFQIADVNGDWIPDMVYSASDWNLPKKYWKGGNAYYDVVQLGEITKSVKRSGWKTDDKIAGGKKADVLKGRAGDDMLNGNGGNDRIDGNSGRDLLLGGGGRDKLNGSSGSDKLLGEKGNDRLDGGQGRDLIKGGSGQDKVIYRKGYDKDLIVGFQDNVDTLVLNDNLWGGKSKSVKKVLSQFGQMDKGDAILDFGGGDQIRIKNMTLTKLMDDIEIA